MSGYSSPSTVPKHSEKPVLFFFLFSLAVMLLMPNAGQATLPAPASVEMRFVNAGPACGVPEPLTVTVTAMADEQAVIEIDIPHGIQLVEGATSHRESLTANTPVSIPLTVVVPPNGSWTLTATVRTVKGPPGQASGYLSVIADRGRLEVAKDALLALRYRRGDLPREGRQVLLPERLTLASLSEAYMTAEEEQANRREEEFFNALHAAVASSGGDEAPGAERESQHSPVPQKTVTVSGSMTYRDANGKVHPARMVVVEILDAATAKVAGRAVTNFKGAFTAQVKLIDKDGKGPDVQVQVLSEIGYDHDKGGVGAFVAFVGPDMDTVYKVKSPVKKDIKGKSVAFPLTTPKPVPGATDDSDTARVFSVLDACLEGALQTSGLNGFDWLLEHDPIPVVFPASETNYDPNSPKHLNIERQYALVWDVILHEFFHYMTYTMRPQIIVGNPGGIHGPYWGSVIGVANRDKGDGLNYAWAEGLATFLAVATQHKPVVESHRPDLPLSGDQKFDLCENNKYFFVDIETLQGYHLEGYASEASIAGVLWDFLDKAKDKDKSGPATDNTETQYKSLWGMITKGTYIGPSTDVIEFYSNAMDRLGKGMENHLADKMKHNAVFVLNRVSPVLIGPSNGAILDPEEAPKFSWTPNGDPNSLYQNKARYLYIYKKGFTEKVYEKAITTDLTSFNMDAEDWAAITFGLDAKTQFEWFIYADNAEAPATPRTGYYLMSDSHSFSVEGFTPQDISVSLFAGAVPITYSWTQYGGEETQTSHCYSLYYDSTDYWQRPPYGKVVWSGKSFHYEFKGHSATDEDSPLMRCSSYGGGYYTSYDITIEGTLDASNNLVSATIDLTADRIYPETYDQPPASWTSQGNVTHASFKLANIPLTVQQDSYGTIYSFLIPPDKASAMISDLQVSWADVYPWDNGIGVFISADWTHPYYDLTAVGALSFRNFPYASESR